MAGFFTTEHGNVSSHVQHEKACLKYGLKAGFGLEAYYAETATRAKFHLTLLAMDQEGYRNLNRIVSRSWAEEFYQWPTVTPEILREHSSGLIVLSGCADSLLSCTLLGGKSLGEKRESISSESISDAEATILSFKELFGDRYYLEMQQFPGLERTRTLNPTVAELGRKLDVPIVATSDCHYPYPGDNEMQKILHAAGRGAGSIEAQEATWEYDIRLTPPVSDAEIGRNLMGTGLSRRDAWTAILNSEEILQRCNVTLPKNPMLRFPLEEGYSTPKDLIWDWLRDGWKYRWERSAELRADPDKAKRMLFHEMKAIEGQDGYMDYFLMLSEAVRFAKDRGIPVGPARGSAAASITLWLLRVTEVNPMMFPTMRFERFIDAARTDLPDVDLDFSDDRRDEVREHLIELYGADRVGNIGNFVRYRGKNSINDVARVYGIPFTPAETVKGLIIERSGGDSRVSDSLQDTFDTFPEAKRALEEYPELQNAVRLEGNYRGMSVHAAGLVISNSPIADTCALLTREVPKGSGHYKTVLPYDKKDAEYLGMLKADFLGLKTMGMIDLALTEIGMSLDELYQVPLDDEKTLEAFKRGDVIGIFQFEGRATRLVNADVSPDNFMELADINALSRPGPLFSGMASAYIDVKHGGRERESLHPAVDEFTEFTKGQIIYQEQVLGIIKDVGGFPMAKVGDIRRIISQKLGEAQFNNMLQMFQEGAHRLHGIDKELATRIWKFMVTSATYSFNVAHCISYSMLGFWCMWLKQHHPLAFYAAQLQKVGDDKEAVERKRPRLLRDAQRHGIKVLPPDLQRSRRTWSSDPETQSVLGGFSQIAGIGPSYSVAIEKARDANPSDFQIWADLQKIRGIGPKKIELIKDFAESDDPYGIDYVRNTLNAYREGMLSYKREWRGTPRPTHVSDSLLDAKDRQKVVWMGLVKSREYKDLIEDERAKSGDDVAEILARVKDPHLLKSCVLKCYDDGDEEVYVRINRWNFPRYEKALESIEMNKDVVIVTGLKSGGFGVSVQIRGLVIIAPDDEEDGVLLDDVG